MVAQDQREGGWHMVVRVNIFLNLDKWINV